MDLVVRCPSCRGVASVDADARGLTVQCPRCADTFIAVPEAALVEPQHRTRNPSQPASTDEYRSRRDEPRPRRDDSRTRSRREPYRSRRGEPDYAVEKSTGRRKRDADHDHDPHRHVNGGLSPSVLIGLALLPYAIPILWLTAPAILGQAPLISIAVPIAIAVSASTLSLAVIYTIDWSPSVRVKGVLMLLCLAYFISISLYFVNKEIVEKMKDYAGNVGNIWLPFVPPSRDYTVKLPKPPKLDESLQPIRNIPFDCYTVRHANEDGELIYVVGSGQPNKGKDREPGSRHRRLVHAHHRRHCARSQGPTRPRWE